MKNLIFAPLALALLTILRLEAQAGIWEKCKNIVGGKVENEKTVSQDPKPAVQVSVHLEDGTEFIHVKQKPPVSGPHLTEETKRDVGLSQWSVLEVLSQHTGAAVFVEGVKGFFNVGEDSVLRLATLFGDLKAHSYQEVPQIQRDLLIRVGAPLIAYSLGKIKLHGTVTDHDPNHTYRNEQLTFLRDTLPPEIFEDVMKGSEAISLIDQNERMALQEIRNYRSSASYRGERILLVYGENHDFKKYETSPR